MREFGEFAIHNSALVARAQKYLQISYITWPEEPPFDVVSGGLGFLGITLVSSVGRILMV